MPLSGGLAAAPCRSSFLAYLGWQRCCANRGGDGVAALRRLAECWLQRRAGASSSVSVLAAVLRRPRRRRRRGLPPLSMGPGCSAVTGASFSVLFGLAAVLRVRDRAAAVALWG